MSRELQPGKRVEGYSQASEPGDFWWTGNPPMRLTFKCPCGCGANLGVAVAADPADRGGNHPIWQWNGDLEKPTVTPSIQYLDGCRWHGFLTDGVFKQT